MVYQKRKQNREQKLKKGNRFYPVGFDKRLKFFFTQEYGLAESEEEKSVVEANKVS